MYQDTGASHSEATLESEQVRHEGNLSGAMLLLTNQRTTIMTIMTYISRAHFVP